MLRSISKNDIGILLDGLTGGLTFPQANKLFGINPTMLSKILKELEWFGLITNKEGIFKTHPFNRLQWEKYNRELDYQKLARSDKAKKQVSELGVFTEIQDYTPVDGKIVIEDSSEGWDEDAEIYEVRD